MKFKLIIKFLICFIFLSVNSHAVEYGITFEDMYSIDNSDNPTLKSNLINFNLKKLQLSSELDEPVFYEHMLSFDEEEKLNEELFEFIGMFVSHYNSKRKNVRIKMKFTKDAELDKGYLQWKIPF